MSQKYSVQIKWDRRNFRYVAQAKAFPGVIAIGQTIAEAQEDMNRKIQALHKCGEGNQD